MQTRHAIRPCHEGFILIDIILALALGAIFTAIIAGSSFEARQMFGSAGARNAALDAYAAAPTVISSGFYGNDRNQTISISVVSSTSAASSSGAEMRFAAVYAQASSSPILSAVGTSLCSPDFSDTHVVGSYQSPATLAMIASSSVSIVQIGLPISPTLPLTDLEVRDGIAYISVDSSVASDPDIIIADIHDPAHPAILSSLNTGPGISALALAGRNIFAAADSAAAELHVIGLNSPNSLALLDKYKLPLPYATATAPTATSIFYDQGKAYLGTQKWDGAEFDIIDVADPLQPLWQGGLEVGSKVNGIYVRDGLAYIATAAEDQLMIADIHDPAHPAIIGSFSPSGWQRQEGEAVSYFEDSLGLGRTSGGYDITTDPEAFSWASASVAMLGAGSSLPASSDVPGGIYGILTDEKHLYLATRQVDAEFQIWDRGLSTSTAYSLPVAPQSMTCDGRSIYILAHAAPDIYQITFN